MDEIMVFDPYAYTALAAYLVGVAAVTGGLAFVARAKSNAVLGALASGLNTATHLGRAVFAALPGGKYLIYAGGHVSEVSGSGATEFSPVSRYAMVKDMDAQTGVVLTSGKTNHCVTGLGPMGRILAQPRPAGAEDPRRVAPPRRRRDADRHRPAGRIRRLPR
jgi:hypothetical protein